LFNVVARKLTPSPLERKREKKNAPLRVPALELTSEEVAQPSFEEGDDTTKEEEPDAPSWSPETDSGTFADGTRVEAGVDLSSSSSLSVSSAPKGGEAKRNRYSRHA
jgi:hypothetical protein